MKTPNERARETAEKIYEQLPGNTVEHTNRLRQRAERIFLSALTYATADLRAEVDSITSKHQLLVQEKLDWESDKAELEREINEYKEFHRNVAAARKEDK